MKKLKIFQITLIVIFIAFILFLFRDVNYTKEYQVSDVFVTEEYNKDSDYYYFTLTYNDYTLDYLYESNYKQKRTFINKIELIEDENNFCLIPEGDTLEFIPLCVQDNEITYYKNVNESLRSMIPDEYLKEEKELSENYEDINISNRDYTYLLWKYNGFYYINDEEERSIDLFNQELYNVTLVGYTKDYLLIANYDDEYTFDKIYRISLKDGSLREFDLEYDIYFDSYFIGFEKNRLYIIDNKEEQMYELNAQNGSLEKISARIYEKGNWESVGIKSLINQNKQFTYKSNFEYELTDHTLYLKYSDKDITTKIDDEVTKLVRTKDNLVFYLKTDTLYVFEPLIGKRRLMSYFEWNFNDANMIYVD